MNALRFRRAWCPNTSLHLAASSSERTSEPKSHQNRRSLVSFRIRNSPENPPHNTANLGLGTLMSLTTRMLSASTMTAPRQKVYRRRQGNAIIALVVGFCVTIFGCAAQFEAQAATTERV